MPKYSTGGAGSNGGGQTCELCGSASDSLRSANVAGAELTVCPDCATHDESPAADDDDDSDTESDPDRRERAAQNTARHFDAATGGDSTHWEESGANYDDDQLPYLVTDYGERVVRARQDAGLQREELADELDVDESDLLAVEQGRATQANVGGSVVAALEEFLDVELSDE